MWTEGQPRDSSTPWLRSLLALILFVATMLRTSWPSLSEFKFSEARLEALALELSREGRLPLVGVPSSAGFDHSPLSVYLYLPAFLATTDPIPAVIYGGLVGVAPVALCWWAGRRWPGGGPWAASISAALLAVNPWAVAFSRKIWQITFVPLLALAFVVLLLDACLGTSSRPPEGERPRPWHLAWALAIYAVLVQVHPSAISLAPALLLWLLVFRRHVQLMPFMAGAGLGVLSAIPFLIHQLRAGWPVLQAFAQLPQASWDLAALRLSWEAITGRGIQVLAGEAQPALELVPELARAFNLVGWLTIVSALVLVWRMAKGWKATAARWQRASRVDLVVLSWLILPVLYNLQHSLDLHLHFFALVMPAACLVIGRGLGAVLSALRPTMAGRAARLGSTALVSCLASAQVGAVLLMASFVSTRDTSGGFGTPLGVYVSVADGTVGTAGAGGEILVVSQGDSPVVDEVPAIFDVLLRDRATYRFVDAGSAALFPAGPSLALVAPDAGRAADWYSGWPSETVATGYPATYRLVHLDGTWPTAGLDEIVGARLFQCGVGLQAYDWRLGPSPGAGGELWLLWQVLWKSPEGTHFTVRILDRAERPWGSQDGPGYPPAQRRKGDRVISVFDITAETQVTTAPSWARIGMYAFPEVVPVPVIDQAGRPVADSVQISIGSR